MISGTVSDYNNHTIALMHEWLGDDVRLTHNSHDGDKFCIKKERYLSIGADEFKKQAGALIERPIEYNGRSIVLTAVIKVYA